MTGTGSGGTGTPLARNTTMQHHTTPMATHATITGGAQGSTTSAAASSSSSAAAPSDLMIAIRSLALVFGAVAALVYLQ